MKPVAPETRRLWNASALPGMRTWRVYLFAWLLAFAWLGPFTSAVARADWPKAELVRLTASRHYLRPPEAELNKARSLAEFTEYLAHLDPYSRYLPAAEYAYLRKRQAREQIGLGLNLLIDDGALLAVPLQQGPAARAGLTRPRYLKQIGKHRIDPDDFASYAFFADFAKGRKTPLLVSRQADGRDNIEYYLPITAPFQNVSLEYLDQAPLPLIRFHAFDGDEHTARVLARLLPGALSENSELVLDLRFCPGGSLYEMIDAVSLFLPAEVEVAVLRSAGERDRALKSLPGGGGDKKTRIFLWVSPFTASSAEIFARILRRHAGAMIIGTPTEGKCLSQQIFELPDGAALQLSVYEVLAPDVCQGQPIVPDLLLGEEKILDDQAYYARMPSRKARITGAVSGLTPRQE